MARLRSLLLPRILAIVSRCRSASSAWVSFAIRFYNVCRVNVFVFGSFPGQGGDHAANAVGRCVEYLGCAFVADLFTPALRECSPLVGTKLLHWLGDVNHCRYVYLVMFDLPVVYPFVVEGSTPPVDNYKTPRRALCLAVIYEHTFRVAVPVVPAIFLVEHPGELNVVGRVPRVEAQVCHSVVVDAVQLKQPNIYGRRYILIVVRLGVQAALTFSDGESCARVFGERPPDFPGDISLALSKNA